MDTVTQALRDPSFTESMEGEPGLEAAMFAPAQQRGLTQHHLLPTIDLYLPPVEAAPRHKGSRQRLQELRASAKRVEAMTPLERDRVRRRARQWLGDL